jgi:hypothetical protein
LVFAAGFAVVGICVLAVALASGPFISVEPEGGTLTGGATVVNDAGASGGKAVQFAAATPSPSPTPTGSTCTNPVFTSSAVQGRWPATGADYVNNNVWNTAEAGPQTIGVCSMTSFYVNSNQPDLANDEGSVKSYPGVCGCSFGDTKTIGQFSNITSSFANTLPQLGEWDTAYDMFTDNWANEIMIQPATHGHPAQDGTPVTIDGIAYHALQVNPNFIVVGMDNFEGSGTVNILHVFQYLESKGWMKSSDTLTAIGYGVEISWTESSPGVKGPERFDFTNFSLTSN